MNIHKHQLVAASPLGCGLSFDQVQKIAEAFQWSEFQSGEVIFREGQSSNSLLLVAEGRIKISASRGTGNDEFIDYLGRGEHFGEMAFLTGQPRSVTATAGMDVRLLELEADDFQSLIREIPELAANISRTLSLRLRRETTGKKVRRIARVIGIVNCSAEPKSTKMSNRLVKQLATELVQDGEHVRVVTDQVDDDSEIRELEYTEIPRNMNARSKAAWVNTRLAEQKSYEGHTLVYLTGSSDEELKEILVHCEHVIWLSTPNNEPTKKEQLRRLLRSESRLAAASHWGWLLPEGFKPENIPGSPNGLGDLDFKFVIGNGRHVSRHEKMSLSRLVRFIRKTRLGLALGGGAARGLAHLGVLKAFEAEGIYFDTIAGTSAGALMAVPYAYGISPDQCSEGFQKDLTPGWLFRHLPKGNEWYMLYQFRMGKWDGLLRKWIANARLEQMLTPVSTVAVDLITGKQVVRDEGDATHAILESINLPNISKPIIRDGMALVDGGIVNNVPGDILPERGADLVVGVDIASQIEHRFGVNTPRTPLKRMRAPCQMRTIMRSNEVQSHQITALRTRNVDQLITVDTSSFDFADFSSAREMSDAGAEAVSRAMGEFKRVLKQQKASDEAASERFVCPTWTKST